MTIATAAARVDNIRHSLVGLKMPRALEMLDATLRRIEQGEIDGIEAIDDLLTEELSLRENRRVKAALRMARLPLVKTLAGFDFSFQPSLDRSRIMALASLRNAKGFERRRAFGNRGLASCAATRGKCLDCH